jgi:hypothetical protein
MKRAYGQGRIFLRGKRWSVRFAGKEYSTGSNDPAVAEKLLAELQNGAAADIALRRQVARERKAARHAVDYALTAGRLKRELCVKCGDKAQAHHEDYSRPLDVVWLCARHHRELHRNQRDVLAHPDRNRAIA